MRHDPYGGSRNREFAGADQFEPIRGAAIRHKEFLRYIDMPLDIFEAGYHRVKSLVGLREAVDRLYPHALPDEKGTRLLNTAARKLGQHVEECEKLRDRLEEAHATRGSSMQEYFNLNQQIAELKTLHKYVSYHARTYAEGVPLPTRELWSL